MYTSLLQFAPAERGVLPIECYEFFANSQLASRLWLGNIQFRWLNNNIGVDIVEKPSMSIFFSMDFIHAITLPSLYLQIHHLHSYVILHQSKYIPAVKLTAAA